MVRETRHLWIGNLPENVREDQIRELFQRHGRVQSVKVFGGAGGNGVRGKSATVAFIDIQSASKALRGVHSLSGNPLRITYHEPQAARQTSPPTEVLEDTQASHIFDKGARFFPPPFDEHPSPRHPEPSPNQEPSQERRNSRSPNGVKRHKSRSVSESGSSEGGSSGERSRSGSRSSATASVSSGRSRSPANHVRTNHTFERRRRRREEGRRSSSSSGSSSPQRSRPRSPADSFSPTSVVGGLSGVSGVVSGGASGPRRAKSELEGAIRIRNLPLRSSDTSLKDGLYHEYKKHGKLLWVRVVGTGAERYAIVCFKSPEHASRAVGLSQEKLFFGARILVSPYHPEPLDDGARSGVEEESSGPTRTIILYGMDAHVGEADVQNAYETFGPVLNVELRRCGSGSLGLVEYGDIGSAVRAQWSRPCGLNASRVAFARSPPANHLLLEGTNGLGEKDVATHCAQFGSLAKTTLDPPRASALVHFIEISAAVVALRELRNWLVNKRPVQVDFASPSCVSRFIQRISNGVGPLSPDLRPISDPITSPVSPELEAKPLLTPSLNGDDLSEVLTDPRIKSSDSGPRRMSECDDPEGGSTPLRDELPDPSPERKGPEGPLSLPLPEFARTSRALSVSGSCPLVSSSISSLPSTPPVLTAATATTSSHLTHGSHNNSNCTTPSGPSSSSGGGVGLSLSANASAVSSFLQTGVPGLTSSCGGATTPSSSCVPSVSSEPSVPEDEDSKSSDSGGLSPKFYEEGEMLDKRIQQLYEKYDNWSVVRGTRSASESLEGLSRFAPLARHRLLDLDELRAQPSDIFKTVASKRSIFDEDSKRLENFGEKYEAKVGNWRMMNMSRSFSTSSATTVQNVSAAALWAKQAMAQVCPPSPNDSFKAPPKTPDIQSPRISSLTSREDIQRGCMMSGGHVGRVGMGIVRSGSLKMEVPWQKERQKSPEKKKGPPPRISPPRPVERSVSLDCVRKAESLLSQRRTSSDSQRNSPTKEKRKEEKIRKDPPPPLPTSHPADPLRPESSSSNTALPKSDSVHKERIESKPHDSAAVFTGLKERLDREGVSNSKSSSVPNASSGVPGIPGSVKDLSHLPSSSNLLILHKDRAEPVVQNSIGTKHYKSEGSSSVLHSSSLSSSGNGNKGDHHAKDKLVHHGTSRHSSIDSTSSKDKHEKGTEGPSVKVEKPESVIPSVREKEGKEGHGKERHSSMSQVKSNEVSTPTIPTTFQHLKERQESFHGKEKELSVQKHELIAKHHHHHHNNNTITILNTCITTTTTPTAESGHKEKHNDKEGAKEAKENSTHGFGSMKEKHDHGKEHKSYGDKAHHHHEGEKHGKHDREKHGSVSGEGPALVGKDRHDSVSSGSSHKESSHKDSLHKESSHKESIHKDLTHKESTNKDLTHKDSTHKERHGHSSGSHHGSSKNKHNSMIEEEGALTTTTTSSSSQRKHSSGHSKHVDLEGSEKGEKVKTKHSSSSEFHEEKASKSKHVELFGDDSATTTTTTPKIKKHSEHSDGSKSWHLKEKTSRDEKHEGGHSEEKKHKHSESHGSERTERSRSGSLKLESGGSHLKDKHDHGHSKHDGVHSKAKTSSTSSEVMGSKDRSHNSEKKREGSHGKDRVKTKSERKKKDEGRSEGLKQTPEISMPSKEKKERLEKVKRRLSSHDTDPGSESSKKARIEKSESENGDRKLSERRDSREKKKAKHDKNKSESEKRHSSSHSRHSGKKDKKREESSARASPEKKKKKERIKSGEKGEKSEKKKKEPKKTKRIIEDSDTTDHSEEDEQKHHSIFEVVVDEYVSMYDKVKSRSNRACKKVPPPPSKDEKKTEKTPDIFASLKKSRAKREEKKRSTSIEDPPKFFPSSSSSDDDMEMRSSSEGKKSEEPPQKKLRTEDHRLPKEKKMKIYSSSSSEEESVSKNRKLSSKISAMKRDLFDSSDSDVPKRKEKRKKKKSSTSSSLGKPPKRPEPPKRESGSTLEALFGPMTSSSDEDEPQLPRPITPTIHRPSKSEALPLMSSSLMEARESRESQNREQNREIQRENREIPSREIPTREILRESRETREIQSREVQNKEIQSRESRDIPSRETREMPNRETRELTREPSREAQSRENREMRKSSSSKMTPEGSPVRQVVSSTATPSSNPSLWEKEKKAKKKREKVRESRESRESRRGDGDREGKEKKKRHREKRKEPKKLDVAGLFHSPVRDTPEDSLDMSEAPREMEPIERLIPNLPDMKREVKMPSVVKRGVEVEEDLRRLFSSEEDEPADELKKRISDVICASVEDDGDVLLQQKDEEDEKEKLLILENQAAAAEEQKKEQEKAIESIVLLASPPPAMSPPPPASLVPPPVVEKSEMEEETIISQEETEDAVAALLETLGDETPRPSAGAHHPASPPTISIIEEGLTQPAHSDSPWYDDTKSPKDLEIDEAALEPRPPTPPSPQPPPVVVQQLIQPVQQLQQHQQQQGQLQQQTQLQQQGQLQQQLQGQTLSLKEEREDDDIYVFHDSPEKVVPPVPRLPSPPTSTILPPPVSLVVPPVISPKLPLPSASIPMTPLVVSAAPTLSSATSGIMREAILTPVITAPPPPVQISVPLEMKPLAPTPSLVIFKKEPSPTKEKTPSPPLAMTNLSQLPQASTLPIVNLQGSLTPAPMAPLVVLPPLVRTTVDDTIEDVVRNVIPKSETPSPPLPSQTGISHLPPLGGSLAPSHPAIMVASHSTPSSLIQHSLTSGAMPSQLVIQSVGQPERQLDQPRIIPPPSAIHQPMSSIEHVVPIGLVQPAKQSPLRARSRSREEEIGGVGASLIHSNHNSESENESLIDPKTGLLVPRVAAEAGEEEWEEPIPHISLPQMTLQTRTAEIVREERPLSPKKQEGLPAILHQNTQLLALHKPLHAYSQGDLPASFVVAKPQNSQTSYVVAKSLSRPVITATQGNQTNLPFRPVGVGGLGPRRPILIQPQHGGHLVRIPQVPAATTITKVSGGGEERLIPHSSHVVVSGPRIHLDQFRGRKEEIQRWEAYQPPPRIEIGGSVVVGAAPSPKAGRVPQQHEQTQPVASQPQRLVHSLAYDQPMESSCPLDLATPPGQGFPTNSSSPPFHQHALQQADVRVQQHLRGLDYGGVPQYPPHFSSRFPPLDDKLDHRGAESPLVVQAPFQAQRLYQHPVLTRQTFSNPYAELEDRPFNTHSPAPFHSPSFHYDPPRSPFSPALRRRPGSPPPAHHARYTLPPAEAPASREESRQIQVQTPPHASQVPPQGDSLLMLLQRYPIMWQGLLALKNDNAACQMHFVSGNMSVARESLPAQPDGSVPPLRISQRMRLEQTQLEGVARKMQMEAEHCMLLALPCGRDHMDVLQQSNNLRNGFITYLQLKQAAGIVNICHHHTQMPAYVIHIFPSCDFANENLARIAPDLLHGVADIAHLLIVIATST